MKPIGIVQVLAGTVAIIGALGMAYMLVTLGQAIGTINSANPADFPAGTDMSVLQETANSLGNLILLGWVWTITVLLSGAFSIKAGVGNLRARKGKVPSFSRK